MDESAPAPMNLYNMLDQLRGVLREREEARGEPERVLSVIAEFWTTYLWVRHPATGSSLTASDVAYMEALGKIARAAVSAERGLSPDPDNGLDVGGYGLIAALIAQMRRDEA